MVLPRLTTPVKRLLLIVALIFAVSTSLRINGSSSSYWSDVVWNGVRISDSPKGVLLSKPKGVRTDEWLMFTPAILSQARSQPPFPTSNPSYGPGKVPLIMSLPAQHYTMLFRPALWGYFLFPFEFAFAWHWNIKIFGLFVGMFLLFWALTDGRLDLSLAGAAMVQFSSFVQWWFSSPAMLPEMLTAYALGVTASLVLFTPQPPVRRGLWMLVLVVSIVNFVLCCYPPFQIPLIYLALCLVVGFVWQKALPIKPGWVLMSLLIAALLILPWFIDCRDTLAIVAQTVYPGHRESFGGHLSIAHLFSGLFTFDIDEENCPTPFGNICEASNFYPIWWLSMGLGVAGFARFVFQHGMYRGELPQHGRILGWLSERGMKVMLAAYIAVFTWYALAPLPKWFCHLTLLSRCTEQRNLLGLGLAGMFLIVLCVASRETSHPLWSERIITLLGWCGAVLLVFIVCRGRLPSFLIPWRLAAFGATAVFLGTLYLIAPPKLFAIGFSALLFCKTALVNPLCAGLPELLESPALNQICALVRSDRSALWAAYNSDGSELIKACGGHVLDGIRIVPDLPMLRKLDPEGKWVANYNRYVFMTFEPQDASLPPEIVLKNDIFCYVKIHPGKAAELFPALKYIMASNQFRNPESARLKLLESFPQLRIWIYQLLSD
ncbi:MAG TPA: hypothetical protein DHU55_15075 [Blastocatellia bacterium]|nr:hypothetical protein [Blastocatellia bacterium]HCX31070.1 hypothetical protein [Blastocatellia bacterium]